MDALTVLMPTCNGARFLPAQLESLTAQSLHPDRLIVSDDGSTDATAALLTRFADRAPFPVSLGIGPRTGVGGNTLALLARAPADRGVALCDQDDVWRRDRLARAARALARAPACLPVLYCARRVITDARLMPRGLSPWPHRPGFANALVENIAPANTIALNPAALALARAAAGDAALPPLFPDWWLYQLITGAGGRVICDPVPVLWYRQHGGNLFGGNAGMAARLTRLRQVWDGTYRHWRLTQARRLAASRHRLTAEGCALLDRVRAGQTPRALYRHSLTEQVMLRLAFTLGRA